MAHLCYRLNRGHLALMAPPARLDSGGSSTPDAATPTTNQEPPVGASTGTVALISMGAAGGLNGKETAADRGGFVAVGRASSSTEETVPAEAELGSPVVPLPDATASLPAVFVGDSAVDNADGEQLIRKDLSVRNMEATWDEWLGVDHYRLFNAQDSFDVFGEPENNLEQSSDPEDYHEPSCDPEPPYESTNNPGDGS
jgi:hypothetical protein